MSDSGPNVLLVIAHPDDEVFVSGTLCLCRERGCNAAIVCITGGEGGEHPFLPDNEKKRLLKQIRRRELELSALSLGVEHVEILDFPNVGWKNLAGHPPWDEHAVASALAQTIDRYAPELILTHGPGGGYGHPEHKSVFNALMSAVQVADFRHSMFSFCAAVDSGGYLPQYFDAPSDVVIDVRRFNQRRKTSLRYHQSQLAWFLRRPKHVASRRFAAALFGRLFSFSSVGRRRVAFASPDQFIEKLRFEGLALQKAPVHGGAHFFEKYFADDQRVRFVVRPERLCA